MTSTNPQFGDPTEWDEIPTTWTTVFTTAIQAHGHTVTDAHESAITVDVPGLEEGHEWYIAKPNFHGMWAYGIANERGYCANPMWLDVDAADPQAVADAVHAVLSGAPMDEYWLAGASARRPLGQAAEGAQR